MQPFLALLMSRLQAKRVDADVALAAAFAQLDHMLAALADDLRVEYFGPEVGVGAGRQAYRLVVREHATGPGERAWALRVCTALPHAGWRADWAIHAASRQRQALIVQALPAFFAGFSAAVGAAGKADTNAGRKVEELARLFTNAATGAA